MAATPQRIKHWALTFDWVLLTLIVGISLIGLINLRSAAQVLHQPLHGTQLVWLLFGGGLAAVAATIDYRTYERWGYVFFGIGASLLFLVLIAGEEFNGSRRWLDTGLFLMQPSEIMKIAVIVVTAKFFSERDKRGGYSITDLALPFGVLLIPMALVFLQPDLGTTILLFLLAFSIAFFEGIRASSLVILFLSAVILAPITYFGVMEEYQQDRIKTFLQLEDERDDLGRDWQSNQSIIAVGHGGLLGRGFEQGTQIQKGFVPEPENDFALANWAEEQGFVGASGLIALYFALIFWGLRIARNARDRFGALLAIGISAMIFWQVIINFGMVLRVMPVVGITLPLVSYGGSSVLTILIGVGLLMNVSLRRHLYKGS